MRSRPMREEEHMSPKITNYHLCLERCLANAVRAPNEELEALWISCASSYRTLIELDETLNNDATALSSLALIDIPE